MLEDALANELTVCKNGMTHSACAVYIDGDGDIDLYSGDFDAQNDINPQILLNEDAIFIVAKNRLPYMVDLDENHYTYCEFSDVDGDIAFTPLSKNAGGEKYRITHKRNNRMKKTEFTKTVQKNILAAIIAHAICVF